MEALYKGTSLSLLTDLYQVTMGYGYWRLGKHMQPSVFHLYFRKTPFTGGYAISAGLDTALEYLEQFRFAEEDCAYLRGLMADDGTPLLSDGYVDYLRDMKLDVRVLAVPEGELVFPNEPLLRIEGPLLQAQLLETPLLTIIGFQSLVATKASRVCRAATTGNVLDFGLRRAQGPDGGVSMSRAAFIGGCTATSNVLAGRLFDIPVKGTHAHSWVMSFPDELEAFEAYADVCPNNAVMLVDSYDTIHGVQRAIDVGLRMKAEGHHLAGIRLDSGDLAALSIEARRMMDAAGLTDAKIVASDDLDEHRIARLCAEGARVDLWGVGTRIATCYDQPALGCVYKLSSVAEADGTIRHCMKAAKANPAKATIPGDLNIVRYYDEDGEMVRDFLYASDLGRGNGGGGREVLVLAWRGHERVCAKRALTDIQATTRAALASLPEEYKALKDAPRFPVDVEARLAERKAVMAAKFCA